MDIISGMYKLNINVFIPFVGIIHVFINQTATIQI